MAPRNGSRRPERLALRRPQLDGRTRGLYVNVRGMDVGGVLTFGQQRTLPLEPRPMPDDRPACGS